MTELTLDRAWPCIFTPCDAQKVASIQLAPETWAARQPLVHASIPLSSSLYLEHGLLGRYRTDRLGRRQFLSLQIPGDRGCPAMLPDRWAGAGRALPAGRQATTGVAAAQA